MPGLRFVWMTGINYRSPFWRNFSVGRRATISGIRTRNLPQILRNGRQFHARIGTWVFAMIHARIIGNTDSAANVEDSTGPENLKNALRSCRKEDEAGAEEAQGVKAVGVRTRQFSSSSKRKTEDLVDGPRFKRRYLWTDAAICRSPAALDTETAVPFISPPSHLLEDPSILSSLSELQGYINTETPFDVDKLELILSSHPNQPFVRSVIRSLREGFWPFDDGVWDDDFDDMDNYSSEELDLMAIRSFRDKECEARHWSPQLPFDHLLPGMKTSPMFVVWQKHKPRIITDHAGSGLNNGISKDDSRVKYDDMHPFGQAMRQARSKNPSVDLVLYKSDVAAAFLNLPAHPLWQLRQVVSVDGKKYIVRRLVFGNRASPRCWCAVSALICWIGEQKLNIIGLHVYMDDYFGWDLASNMVFFQGRLRPKRQVQLLLFWDSIRCPYDLNKQDHGSSLKIIGFWVEINKGTITLSPDSISLIVASIDSFLSVTSRQQPLREWQRLAGHLNWVLNVLPWGRPALSELYRKIGGKSRPSAKIFLNATVHSDLRWLAETIPKSIGIRFLDEGSWNDLEADVTVWTDANLKDGLAFSFSNNGFVYQQTPHASSDSIDIFFLELVAILSAIHHLACLPRPPQRLLIFTDSLNSVAVFNSLSASEKLHNGVLLAVAKIILQSGIDLRVRHIIGKENIRADLLSRLLFDEYRQRFPQDRVRLFAPPRELLPARWQNSF
jgi:hypothetical protein